MKNQISVAIVFLSLSLSNAVHADEGGVISGGPNAIPNESDLFGNGRPAGAGGVFKEVPTVPIINNPKTDFASGALRPTWIYQVTEKEFDSLAIGSIRSPRELIFVNREIGAVKTHNVDVLNRKITGMTESRIPIQLEQIKQESVAP